MYEAVSGNIKFLESICDYYKRNYGVGYKPTDISYMLGASRKSHYDVYHYYRSTGIEILIL